MHNKCIPSGNIKTALSVTTVCCIAMTNSVAVCSDAVDSRACRYTVQQKLHNTRSTWSWFSRSLGVRHSSKFAKRNTHRIFRHTLTRKPSFVIFDIRPECPDVKNYKWRLNSVWHRMLYSCTHMATVGVEGLNVSYLLSYLKQVAAKFKCSSFILFVTFHLHWRCPWARPCWGEQVWYS